MRSRARVPSSMLALATLAVGCAGEAEPPPAREITSETKPAHVDEGSWRQWGGPHGDFTVRVEGLADEWPAAGPPQLWSRPLGDGYSAIAADDGVLFTMYRDGDEDVAVALRADDGEEIWSHRYQALTDEKNATQFGKGPNATPLVLDDRVVTLGYTGALHCLDLKTGDVIWSHQLLDDFGGVVMDFGYSASPILHDGHVIVLVGGEQAGAMAFDPADGSTVWRSSPTSVSYATPLVADVGGQEQLLYFSADAIVAVEASNGGDLWSFPVENRYRNNATGPHWGADDLLWVATQLDGGTRALRLTRQDDQTVVEEVWSSNKLSIHFWNSIRVGDTVYASIGSNASILAAIDISSGEIRWRERGFEQVNLIHAGERSILLDANGHLALAELSPEGIDIKAQAKILEGPAWTVPTLIGTTLFVRDKQEIRALDLGAAGETASSDDGSRSANG